LVAVRPQVVKNYADGSIHRMFNLTFSAAKYAYLLMLALVIPICFEVSFILHIWLGDSAPDETAIFIVITLITYLMETFHMASLMPYHAIGKIKLGNIVGGTLMILALPLSYIALKLGAPSYSVFIVIFFVNLTQMFWGWYIVHKYETFSYIDLLQRVYKPTIIVTMITIIPPIIIRSMMEEGWLRLIILTLVTEIVLLFAVYIIAMNKEERVMLNTFIRNKLKK